MNVTKKNNSIEKVPTFIEGFESISKGGLPKNRLTLISGTPGSGKTIFSAQFLASGIMENGESGVFVTFEESPEDIKTNMRNFGWMIERWEEENKWSFVDASPKLEDQYIINGNYDLGGFITRVKSKINNINANRLVIDSLGFIIDKYPNKNIIRNELLRLKKELRKFGVTTILTAERYEQNSRASRHSLEEFLSDNVIILRNTSSKEQRRRTIEILKFRGSGHEKGAHSFTIRENKGIVVISFLTSQRKLSLSTTRKTIGITKLDEMMGGGVFGSSIILISGETGIGKSIFSLMFLNGGLQNGEKVLMISFEEKRERIIFRSQKFGFKLKEMEKASKLKLVCLYPEVKGIEEHIVDLRKIIDSFNPDRVVIDSISALERIADKKIYQESIINFFLLLRNKNITGLFTSTSPTFMSKKDVIERHISTLTDVIIIMRYVEHYGKIKRGLSIVKMRDSIHSKSIFEFEINDKGIEIKSPFKNITGILEGKVHLNK
ncbi:MAG: KaiC-like protein 2 [Promethearchaeota archaeon]|nr:MAG: KaiC-like protein 2 [Candidatus Lokiarchaeota archaeon]